MKQDWKCISSFMVRSSKAQIMKWNKPHTSAEAEQPWVSTPPSSRTQCFEINAMLEILSQSTGGSKENKSFRVYRQHVSNCSRETKDKNVLC